MQLYGSQDPQVENPWFRSKHTEGEVIINRPVERTALDMTASWGYPLKLTPPIFSKAQGWMQPPSEDRMSSWIPQRLHLSGVSMARSLPLPPHTLIFGRQGMQPTIEEQSSSHAPPLWKCSQCPWWFCITGCLCPFIFFIIYFHQYGLTDIYHMHWL